MKNELKIIKLFFVAVFSLLLFQNCSNNNEEAIIEDNSKLLDVLAEWGFNENDIVDMGDHYLVENDIMFFKNKDYAPPVKEDLTSKSSGTKGSLQTHTTYLVSQANRNITIGFHSQVSNAWKTAVRAAFAEWNSICNVYFSETSYSSADIKVEYKTSGAASAGFPTSNGEPGSWLKINNNGIGSYSALAKEWVIVHELGHAIGLKHSYNSTGSCTNVSNIPGTPDCDFNSIMGFNTGGNTFSFTSYDKIAAKWLFPYAKLTPSSMTLNTQQPGGQLTVTGTGPVTITLSGGSGLYLWDENGSPYQSTLNLTAPTSFSVYGPGIGAPGYNGGTTYVNLSSPNKGIVSTSTIYHSN